MKKIINIILSIILLTSMLIANAASGTTTTINSVRVSAMVAGANGNLVPTIISSTPNINNSVRVQPGTIKTFFLTFQDLNGDPINVTVSAIHGSFIGPTNVILTNNTITGASTSFDYRSAVGAGNTDTLTISYHDGLGAVQVKNVNINVR